MATIVYKDYVGKIEYDYEDDMYFGKVLGTKHDVLFNGRSVKEAEEDFREAVDDYLDFIGSEE